MWLREVQRRSCWTRHDATDPSVRELAVKDLFRSGDEKVSFFRVHSEDETRCACHLFALTVKAPQDTFDYLLLEEEPFQTFQFLAVELCDDEEPLQPYLQERHFELHQLDQQEVANRFLDLALVHNKTPRFREKQVVEFFQTMESGQQKEVLRFQKQPERWQKRLLPFLKP
jgi:hypothetical protein